MSGKKAVVGQQMHLQRGVFQLVDQAPLPRLCRQHLACPRLRCATQQFPHDRTRVIRIVQLRIDDFPAVLFQRMGKLAHRGKDQGDLLGVMPDISRLVRDLGHHDGIARLIRLRQGAERFCQLVAQNQHQAPYHGTGFPAQSKNWPVSAGVSPSITASRFSAASDGATAGWRARYFAVKAVLTVPGCRATQILFL